jgi:hypothetical protein
VGGYFFGVLAVKILYYVLATAFVCVAGSVAKAQDFGGTYIDIGMGQAATNSVMDSIQSGGNRRAAKCIENSSFTSLRCPKNFRANQAPEPMPGTKPVSLSFRYSAARRQENVRSFVQKTRGFDAEGAAKMAQLFASTDVIGQIAAGISPYGLRTDNVADAYTVYWINAWEAARGIAGGAESRSRAQAVKAQVASALLTTQEMANATDAQKQEFAEALLVQAAMINAQMDVAAGDPAQLKAVGRAVRQGAKAMGLDLDTMTLTENGFVPIRGSSLKEGLAPAPGGEEATAVAAADAAPPPAPATNEAAPPYVLMAAAGGAGLAGVFLLGKVMGKKS